MILHCVLLNLREEPGEALAGAMARLEALVGVVPGMRGFEHGPNRDLEGLSREYAYGFVVTFDGLDDVPGYANHPEHVEAGGVLVGLCSGGIAGIQVADIETA